MKSLIVAGSPRKGKHSDRLAELYAKERGAEVIYLRDLNIGFCTGCGHCKKIKKGVCSKVDGMTNLYDKIRKANEIAIFSPIYWWQVTSQAKLFIDRLHALGHDEWKGKRLTFVLNGEAEPSDREYAILHDAFKEMADYLEMEFAFSGVGTEEDDEKMLEEAKKAVLELV